LTDYEQEVLSENCGLVLEELRCVREVRIVEIQRGCAKVLGALAQI
jgi:hypothetical protein